jgi:hypothetical protein
MKKIENWLIIPALLLLFYWISSFGKASINIHWHDSYYALDNKALSGRFLIWLTIVFIFFKIIRARHQSINRKFAVTYLVLTLLLFTIFSIPVEPDGRNMEKWSLFNQVRIVVGAIFLLAQVMFLIYYFVQLVRKPVSIDR